MVNHNGKVIRVRTLIEPELKKLGYFQIDDKLEQIALIQKLFAKTYTFENLDVLLKKDQAMNEEFLIDKLLVQKRGGLCYELNGLLYLVLKAFGFDVILGVGTVWSDQKGWTLNKTHTIVLTYINNNMYLVDSGFGTNLSQRPLQVDGEPVTSRTGTFRLRTRKTKRGSILFEKLTKSGWTQRYAFYPDPVGLEDLDRINKIIHEHPESNFNKTFLIAKALDDGTVSITDRRVNRTWINEKGMEIKDERLEFQNTKEMLHQIQKYASTSTYKVVEQFINK